MPNAYWGSPGRGLGLLSNGEEASKGNDLVLQAYSRFKEDGSINFVGNIEGRDITKGKVDVWSATALSEMLC